MPTSSCLTAGWKSDQLLIIVKQPEHQTVQTRTRSLTLNRRFITIRHVLRMTLKVKVDTMYGLVKHWTTTLWQTVC